jgi:arylsulfatase A-like enzyme
MNESSLVRRVIVVVLDGLRPDAIDAFGLDRIGALMASGASTRTARTVSPSVTAAAMTSLLTGQAPMHHGVVSDRFHIPRSRGPVDPLPRVLAAAGLPSAAFVSTLPIVYAGLARQIARHLGVTRAECSGRGAREIVAAARSQLAVQRRGLILLHWPDADRAGHEHGWMSAPYAEGAREMDRALSDLLDLLQLADDPSTLLIALADHGGGGVVANDHESDHPHDWTIPVVLAGAAMAPAVLGEPISLLDVPTTILDALGVPQPATYEGRSLLAPALAAAAA